VIEVHEYIDRSGRNHFDKWFQSLNGDARLRVTVALAKVGDGNLATSKAVGSGVSELRIDFGPGYRVYFGRDGDTLIFLLGGGTKKRQQADIVAAQILWREFKKGKRQT